MVEVEVAYQAYLAEVVEVEVLPFLVVVVVEVEVHPYLEEVVAVVDPH